MSLTVDRTCTEVRPGSDGRVERGESRPLRTFGSLDAYVLLGDPGAGKTTEFERETRALGEAAAYVSARNFIRLDLESHQEWRDKTLFIDGLDEMRAGAADSRVPLDEIRNRLERLGRPRFRISCREADWLGNNDRRSLEAVSPDGSIAVLHLDPLGEQAAEDLLVSRDPSNGPAAFIHEARVRGIDGLLRNPLTLRLLVDAVEHGGSWPESRLETFDLACRQMASERNEEHRAGAALRPVDCVLDAAGYLCALQLLAGIDGYSLSAGTEESSFVSLDMVGDVAGYRSRAHLECALATRLFTAASERMFSPLHRQVAEFLAGRYLANLISKGLPARRAIALMASPSDGRVVTVLRGLSAWLAAHRGEGRRPLIEADPMGVGLYGDIGDFTAAEKETLLGSLAALATEVPLASGQWPHRRADEFEPDAARAFAALVSPETAPLVQDLLERRGDAAEERILVFVLDVLAKADKVALQSLPALASTANAMVGDPTLSPYLRRHALDAFLNAAPSGNARTETLVGLLDAIREGTLSDPDDELRGTLLPRLYPSEITPLEVWRYASPRNRPELMGRFWRFWNISLIEQSSDQHVADLLDALHLDAPQVIPGLDESGYIDLPFRLLVRGLEALGDEVEPSRLYNWLRPLGDIIKIRPKDALSRRVQEWLEARPQVQKALFLIWLRTRTPDDGLGYNIWVAGHSCRLPPEFGLWCLEEALAIGDNEPAVARELLSRAYESLQDRSISAGLTREALRERTRGREILARHVDALDRPTAAVRSPDRERESAARSALEQLDALRAQARDEEKRQRDEWADAIRSHETELRENTFSPPGLDTLARAYFDLLSGINQRPSAGDRIGYFTNDDERLTDAAMSGLRQAVTRGDVPDAEQTISLHAESKYSLLAFPVLASLDLLDADEPELLDGLDDVTKRNALAIHYCTPTWPASARWHRRWFRKDPDLVLDVLYRCAVAAVRAGDDVPPGLNDLDGLTSHGDQVHQVRLRLLRAFPIRASQTQLDVLDRILGDVLGHSDRLALHALVERKLDSKSMTVAQRTRWVAVEAFLSSGPGLPHLKAWVGDSERRVRHLAEFLRNIRARFWEILDAKGDPTALADTIELLGRTYPPLSGSGLQTLEMDASDRLFALIERLGSLAGDEAQHALRNLGDDPQLAAWEDRLTGSLERQRVVRRDASYGHPTIEELQSTLSDQAPANVADLAGLLVDRLCDISDQMRGANSNLWRQFWNEDEHGNPKSAKHENSCRDSLLHALQRCLPSEVDAAPEGSYAAGRRADIRVSRGAFNVPIEIKKNCHVNLWSALRGQLVSRYTTAPATFGYGVFLVLWFGADKTARPRDGSCPTTPAELAERLEQDLSPDEARKISVIVIDVTKP